MKFIIIPSVFSGQQTWGAYGKNGTTYVILKDKGFTASCKRLGITKYLIEQDSPVDSFDKAKAVCEATENPQ